MSSTIDFVLQMVILVLFIRVDLMKTQTFGSILRDPLNNLIKVFDGSYGSSSDASHNKNHDNSLIYQSRWASNNGVHQYEGNCAGIWSYTTDLIGNTVGLVTIQNPDHSKNVLKLTMSLKSALPSKYAGSIDLAKDKDITAYDIISGLPMMYEVHFPVENPLPKILKIIHNERLLCSETAELEPFVTLSLEYTFILSPSMVNAPRTTSIMQETQKPLITSTYTVPVTSPSVTDTRSYPNALSCGVVDFKPPKTTALVYGGNFAMRKQFPWLAAFYYNGRDETGFICGGSLVSSKVVVTAAHCVQNKGSAAKNAVQSIFYFGKFNLTDLKERYFSFSGVEQFNIHPDWMIKNNKFDADIAIAILTRKISFNPFIMPICLWAITSSFEDLVGHKGTIVGWGKTEYSALPSEKPKWAAITVVSTVDCLRSNSAFNELTSERTFCAGDKNEMTGPCNGDSGGGLVIMNARKWYLRGIVSSSLLAEGVCDTNNFAVFTDVQKFAGWIRSYIEIYG